jgi:hypothetical protein
MFSLTLTLSGALLFLMELIFAKMILPVLGGTTAVWTTCMLFYQAMLLSGYAFANIVTHRTKPKWQAVIFVTLAVAPAMILPFSISAARVPPVDRNPVPWLLMNLFIAVGFPFFVVSAVAPSLQKWFSSIGHPLSSDPYFLYVASNFGSMVGLLSYPILIEPRVRLVEQARLWAYGYAVLVLLIIVCTIILWRAPGPQNSSYSSRVARQRSVFHRASGSFRPVQTRLRAPLRCSPSPKLRSSRSG